ncbi:MAG: acyltransferase [Mycobacterium sp.]
MSGGSEVRDASTTVPDVDRPDRSRPGTLGQVFNPRANALNAWRLGLALAVIVWHSWVLTGHETPPFAVHQFATQDFVDGFFAISGFLIPASWLGNPRLRDYVLARGLRILPGMWVCLVITAFVIAPIGVAIQGGSAAKLLTSGGPLQFVVRNSAVAYVQFDIGGTPTGIPVPGMWNGSLWTLQYEVFLYIVVAVLGVIGLLGRRWLFPVAFALTLAWTVFAPCPFDGGTVTERLARLAAMFAAGALIHRFRDVIPARWSLVAVSAVIVLLANLLPDYRAVAAIPLAYTVIVSGALIHNKRMNLRTDLSYGTYVYACPIQQVLVIAGLGTLNPLVFAIIATLVTLPFAAMSWFLIEKPAMKLKKRINRKRAGPALTRSIP